MFETVKSMLYGRIVKRLLFLGLVLLGGLVVLALSGGTDLLIGLGLSRSVAGMITTSIVTVGCVAALAAFAKYGIDWE